MLGLGTTIRLNAQSAAYGRSPATAWTETSHSSGTTPNMTASGSPTTTVIKLFIDDTNDWSGDATDYSLTSVEVNNTTSGASSTGNTFTFSTQHGVADSVAREIRTSQIRISDLVTAGRGQTVTITGNLTRAGYALLQVTASVSY